MTDHYDSLETRDPAQRDKDQFDTLAQTLVRALAAPGWAKHLAGVDPKSVTSRAALAKLPVLRKSDLIGLQKETPPFGGYNATALGKAKRILMSPGPIFEPEGHGKDYANVARALFAAGFRAGDIVHNCFSYHLTPGAWMFDAGAEALGCADHSRWRRQYRTADRGDRRISSRRAMSARRISSSDRRYRAEVRQGRLLAQKGLGVGRGLAAVAAPGIVRPRCRCAAMLCHRRNRRDCL